MRRSRVVFLTLRLLCTHALAPDLALVPALAPALGLGGASKGLATFTLMLKH